MVNFGDRPKAAATPPPKAEVGEIDTRAPFQSVKAAVSLFGEVKVSRNKPVRRTRLSSENILDKETQLLLAQKELERTKQKLESAETAKARALRDLERVKRTTEELTAKLNAVSKSKESVIQAAEDAKKKTKELEDAKSHNNMGSVVNKNHELDHARQHYISIATEINAAKQELNKIRQDFVAMSEMKQAAFQQEAEAQRMAQVSREKVGELQKEISDMKEGIKQINFATQQANEEQVKIASRKDYLMESYKDAKEAAEQKVSSLKKAYDPEMSTSLEKKAVETTAEIEILQKQMKLAHAAETETMTVVTTELNEAMKTLQEVADEECSLQNLVSSLVLELEEVKKEYKVKAKEAEKEAEKEAKEKEAAEWEAAEMGAAEWVSVVQEKEANEHKLKLEQLSSETETARKEAEEMKKEAEELKQEAETAQMDAKKAEKNVQLALSQVEEAKASEKKVLDQLNIFSSQPVSDSAAACKITITKEEFESLKKEVQESGDLAEKNLAEALAQLEVINASKNEADTKLEADLKAIEEIKAATGMALKSAETSATAQSMVEGELQRWRQQEAEMTAA